MKNITFKIFSQKIMLYLQYDNYDDCKYFTQFDCCNSYIYCCGCHSYVCHTNLHQVEHRQKRDITYSQCYHLCCWHYSSDNSIAILLSPLLIFVSCLILRFIQYFFKSRRGWWVSWEERSRERVVSESWRTPWQVPCPTRHASMFSLPKQFLHKARCALSRCPIQ